VSEFEGLPEDPDDRSSDGFATWFEALSSASSEDELFERLGGQRRPSRGSPDSRSAVAFSPS